MDQNNGLPNKQTQPKRKKSALREIIESIAIAVLLAAIIRIFIFEPFYIPSGSMIPALIPNDRIIVSKLSYNFSEPERGDVIVFKYPKDPSRRFVKRLIAFGGETIEIRNSKLYINGNQIPENYLPKDLQFNDFGPYPVPQNSYFMMGDNRNSSDDSRFWGPLPKENVIGKAVLIYWPLSHLQRL
ncbi:signal peptidase I [Desulfolucanica intricata]|uniref:signal peptidase I n=1 Tax=Desulfolucanica intricata TaxID=1285191 RepID=UPI00082F66B3|nr:signal peptidase I [Desulfolucanica intricata]